MHLDIRLPTIVVAGHWNPHILSFDWVANTLFDTPEGQTVEITQTYDGPRNVIATYLFGVGFACAPERLEIYIDESGDAAAERAEKFLHRVFSTLPHTPLTGIGFNYLFRDAEVSAKFSDAFITSEDLRSRFTITAEDHRTQIKREDGGLLNLRRVHSGNGEEINFNFHGDVTTTEKALEFVNGSILKYLSEARKIISDLYDADEIDILSHKTSKSGDVADAS